MHNTNTIELLEFWKTLNNPNSKVVEFDHFKMNAGLPSFVLSLRNWIEKTNATGIIVKKGRYLENLNAVFITDEMPQDQRLTKLNQIAIHQMNILVQDATLKLNPKTN